MAYKVTDRSFNDDIINYKGYALVDFWADWCGPCKQLEPIIDELSEELGDKLKITKMNIDENPEIPSKLGIRGIPTMILFKDGQKISTKVGALPKGTLEDWINSEVI